MPSRHRLFSIQMLLFSHSKDSINIVIIYTYLQTKNKMATLFRGRIQTIS